MNPQQANTERAGPIHGLWVAFGFLTRIPVGDVSKGGTRMIDIARAVPWFPLIGLLIGAIHGGVYYLASEFVAPIVAAALALGASLLVTGAFHHDGLADIADAFGGGWNVEERMMILKDSTLGTYGVSALALALLIDVASVSQLSPAEGFGALLAAHTMGRASALAAMLLAPTAGDGMGAEYMERLSTPAVSLGIVFGVLVTAFAAPTFWPVAVAAAGIVAIAIVLLAVRKIGGVNGDVLGAITVVSGLFVLVVSGAS